MNKLLSIGLTCLSVIFSPALFGQDINEIKKILSIQQATIESQKLQLVTLKNEVASIKSLVQGIKSGNEKISSIHFENGASIQSSSVGLLLYNSVGSSLAIPVDDHFAYYAKNGTGFPIWSCGGPNCGK